MAASPSSTATERTRAGRAPAGPERLGLGEWVDVFKRAFKEFMKDDCMGLAQQIAFSSLLAFFPAMILLVGLLGLIGAYEDLKEFLGVVAPGAVIEAIDIAQESAADRDTAASFAVVFGAFGAIWAASGAMNSVIKAVNAAYDRIETRPFWKVRLTAIVLVLASGFAMAGLFLLIVFGGPIGEAITSKARLGGAFELAWSILRWPIAFAALLLFFALVYYAAPNFEQRSWKWITPGSLVGALLWLALSGLFALYEPLRLLRQDLRLTRRRHHPAALAELLRLRPALRRGGELRARPPGRHPRGRRRGRGPLEAGAAVALVRPLGSCRASAVGVGRRRSGTSLVALSPSK